MSSDDTAGSKELKPPSAKEKRRLLNPHAERIGKISLAWNELHEQLGMIFWKITGITNGLVAGAIWGSSPSDLQQRSMLRAAVAHTFKTKSKYYIDLIWMLDEIDRISFNRNTAIHIALTFIVDHSGTTLATSPLPLQNKYGKALKDKDILVELTLYQERIYALTRYAGQLYAAILSPKHWPWPNKPVMPTREQKDPRKRKQSLPLPPQESSRQRGPSRASREDS